jgi:hypothetical protein
VTQGSVLSSTLYSIYVNDTPQTPGVYLGLFADDTYIYIYVCDRKMQRGFTSVNTWFERWNIKTNGDKYQGV